MKCRSLEFFLNSLFVSFLFISNSFDFQHIYIYIYIYKEGGVNRRDLSYNSRREEGGGRREEEGGRRKEDSDEDFDREERPYVHGDRRGGTNRNTVGLDGQGGEGIHQSSTQNPLQEEHPRPHRRPLG